jgi:hypothetical protein
MIEDAPVGSMAIDDDGIASNGGERLVKAYLDSQRDFAMLCDPKSDVYIHAIGLADSDCRRGLPGVSE